jgi:hypothetical protein
VIGDARLVAAGHVVKSDAADGDTCIAEAQAEIHIRQRGHQPFDIGDLPVLKHLARKRRHGDRRRLNPRLTLFGGDDDFLELHLGPSRRRKG